MMPGQSRLSQLLALTADLGHAAAAEGACSFASAKLQPEIKHPALSNVTLLLLFRRRQQVTRQNAESYALSPQILTILF